MLFNNKTIQIGIKLIAYPEQILAIIMHVRTDNEMYGSHLFNENYFMRQNNPYPPFDQRSILCICIA